MEKYEITKEQILELENGFRLPKLKQWFPDAFKTELEVGKWYKKDTNLCDWLMNYQGEGSVSYGFNTSKNYSDDYIMVESIRWIEATGQEVKTALVNEAVKRGFKKNNTFKSLDNKYCTLEGTSFLFKKNTLYASDVFKHIIFQNGKWAEIIPTLTKKEAEEKLGVKII